MSILSICQGKILEWGSGRLCESQKKLPVKWSQFISGSRDEGFLRNPWMTPHSTSFTKIIMFMPGKYIYCPCRSKVKRNPRFWKKDIEHHYRSHAPSETGAIRPQGTTCPRSNTHNPICHQPQMCWPCEISETLRKISMCKNFLPSTYAPALPGFWSHLQSSGSPTSGCLDADCFRPAKTGGENLGATQSNAKQLLLFLNLNILASQVRIIHSWSAHVLEGF